MGNRESLKELEDIKSESPDKEEEKTYLHVISDEYSLVLQITDQIGFKVLPNREVCIAGLKLAGQFMPVDPDNKLNFLMKIGKWLSTEMKDCFPNSSGWQIMSRYTYFLFTILFMLNSCWIISCPKIM